MKRSIVKSLIVGAMAAALAFILCSCGIITVHIDTARKDSVAGSGTASNKVRNLDIEWVAGEINIVFDGVDEIRFEESAKEQLSDDAKMRYREADGTLTIEYCKGKTVNNVPPKKLTLVLPNGYTFDHVEFEVVSTDVSLPDGFCANSLELDSVSGNLASAGDAVLKDVEIKGISGNTVLSVEGMKSFEAEVVSGSVQLILPEDTAFTAAVNSASGDFCTDFETNMNGKTYSHGSGGAVIEMNSVSGDLEIKAKK
ncbi:MAG: DUF4097 domain-containing protein [Clostridia bacterium]|nr:DUF4097 domain-containing protein [Clostridia bacterium]